MDEVAVTDETTEEDAEDSQGGDDGAELELEPGQVVVQHRPPVRHITDPELQCGPHMFKFAGLSGDRWPVYHCVVTQEQAARLCRIPGYQIVRAPAGGK